MMSFAQAQAFGGHFGTAPDPGYQHLLAIPTPTIPPGVPVTHGGLPCVVPVAPGGFPLIPPTLGMVPTVPGGLPPIPLTLPAALLVAPSAVIPVAPPVAVPAAPLAVVPVASPAPHIAPLGIRAELLKLNLIKDMNAFLSLLEQIQFYLHMPEFSTGHANESLTTNLGNQEASWVWEGQLHLAVWDGNLRFLFKNKGSQFHGRGFEMLATFMQHCCLDAVSNAFTSLLSLFNNVQGESESILEYRSQFDGLTLKLVRCKVMISLILMAMLFLHALHGWYSIIVDKFRSRFKPIETATLDSIVSDVSYHDGFQVVDHSKMGKPGSNPGPYVPAAALANINSDRQGRVWQSPFEWLAQYGVKRIKGHWRWGMASTSICPTCYRDELPCHVPTKCPMLAELNLKLITCLPAGGKPAPAPGPAPSPVPAPTPGGRAVVADASSVSGSSGSSTAPSSLTAAVAHAPSSAGNYESDDDFHWEGDNLEVEYDAPPKVNMHVAPYSPLCSHISVISFVLESALSPRLQAANLTCLQPFNNFLNKLSLLPVVLPLHHGRLAVADTGATDHMVPEKSYFISYTLISGLSVRMGNNSYVPVLGCGTASFSLNGKQILVRNVLHVPGLAVPLYSPHTHIAQLGCGFIGTCKSGFPHLRPFRQHSN
jgi:hypothetical protein